MQRVTQSEIAKAAKVSRSTVAMVLSENPQARIPEVTRRRILSAAERLGYRPNLFAQVMRTGRTGTVAILNFGGLHQLSAQKLVTAIGLIRSSGYRSLVQNIVWLGQQENGCEEAVNAILDSRVEGVLLVNTPPWFIDHGYERLCASGLPIVSLGGASLSGIPKYLSDKEEGFYRLSCHLMELGYRRITLMLGASVSKKMSQWEWHSNGARTGFQKAAQKYGLSDQEAKLHLMNTTQKGMMDEAANPYLPGYRGMCQILSGKHRPEAVMCSNDTWALGALRACAEQGLNVPEEIAVTGFENELQSEFGLLPLTTVAYPLVDLTQMAVERLIGMIGSLQTQNGDLTTLSGKLVVRQSCGSGLRLKV